MRASAASSSKAVDQQIVFHVVEAYQSVLYAQREIDVAQHEQETAAALLNSVAEHVKAGLAVESDQMSAEVNVAARKEELIAAQGDLELAWAELREAMGAPELKASELKPIEPHVFVQLALDEEIATAAKTRPDLMALAQTQSAQASAVAAARSEFGPTRERVRKLGGRPCVAGQLGWQQLGGRCADQRRHSAHGQARTACPGECSEAADRRATELPRSSMCGWR